jgi:5'-methylthioadenosine phosphorylase
MLKIGIIGGSGLDDPKLLENYSERELETKYGNPSSKITRGILSGAEVYIIARHGKKHEISPSLVNYRANIAAMRLLGCDYILATTAVGSLKEEIKPLDIVFPDQFIDFTKQRKSTFYDEVGEVKHTPMSEPFNKRLRNALCDVCEELGITYHRDKTVITIEGPRFSTKAESHMFRQFSDIINMSACPEAALANEAGIPYQLIAMSTDYDCWKEGEDPVTWEIIENRMNLNAGKVKKILAKGIEKLVNSDEDFIKSKIRAIPNFPKPGIMFRDITTLIKDPEGFQRTMNVFENRYKNKNIDVVAGIESRGFIFGSVLASRLGKGFVPIRKPGKLPYETIGEEYELEYGRNRIEIHKDAIKPGQKVLIIDDLLATSGTMGAACNLIKKLGGDILECGFVIDLEDLGGRKKLENKGYKVFSIVKYEKSG